MAYFFQAFNGSNGSAPSTGTVTAGGGTVNIQGNRLRMVTGSSAGSVPRWGVPGLASGSLLLEVSPNATTVHYVDILFRHSTNNTYANGYSCNLDFNGAQIHLSRWDSGSDTNLDSAAFTYTGGGEYRVRVWWSGSSIKARIWESDDPEPETWHVEVTDATYTAAGNVQIAVYNGSSGAKTVFFNDLFVDDLDSAPGDGTQAAAAFGWGTPIFEEQFTSAAASIDDEDGPWIVFEGAGYLGRGTQSRNQITIADGVMTLMGNEAGETAALGYYPDADDPQMYGRYETRMRIPTGDWLYTVVALLWPFSEIWPGGGEIDFAEFGAGNSSGVGSDVDVGFNLHYALDKNSTDYEDNLVESDTADSVNIRDWHNYAVEWTGTYIRGYLDGTPFFEVSQSAHPQMWPPGPMRFGYQLDWYDDNEPPETAFPAWMQVAWLRQYAAGAVGGGGGSTGLYEPFTGANGSTPNGIVTAGGGTVDIQSNRLHIATGASAGNTSIWAMDSIPDGEFTLELTPTSTADTTVTVSVRATAATGLTASYSLRWSLSDGAVALGEFVAGTFTGADSDTVGVTAGVTYKVKIRFEGSALRAKLWPTSSAEPAAWLLEATDATLTAAGYVQAAVTVGSTSPASRTVLFDEARLTPIASSAITPLGAATGLTGGWRTNSSIPSKSGTLAGDIIIIDFTTSNRSQTVSPPSGFTATGAASDAGSGAQRHYQWWKRSTGSEPANYTVSHTAAWTSGIVHTYRNAAGSGNPVEAIGAAASGASATNSPNVQVTTLGPNRMLHWAASDWNETSWTPPSGFTETYDPGDLLTVAYRAQATAGNSGSTSGTAAVAGARTARLLALIPTSAPSASPPVVSVGAPITVALGATVTRTASESDGGAPIGSRAWTIQSGPTGSGSTIGTTAALSWTPAQSGTYTLRYSATNNAGSGFADLTVTVTVPPPPPSLEEPSESTNLDAVFMLGPRGRLAEIPCPARNVKATRQLFGGLHEGLSGAVVQDVTGVKAQYEFSIPLLTREEYAWLDAVHTGHVRGPFWLLDPLRQNRLSVQATHLYPSWISRTGIRTQAPWVRSSSYPAPAMLVGHSLAFSGWSSTFNFVEFDGLRPIPAWPGERVTGSVWAKASGSHTATLKFRYVDLLGSTLGESTAVSVSVGTSWARHSITKITPEGAAGMILVWTFGASGPMVSLSAPQINAGGAPTAFDTGGGTTQVIVTGMETTYPYAPYRNVTLTLRET